MLTGVWSFVWVVYVFLYTIVAVTIYFIEIWPFENENDDDINNDEVIYVDDINNDEVIYVINFYYSDSSNEDTQ